MSTRSELAREAEVFRVKRDKAFAEYESAEAALVDALNRLAAAPDDPEPAEVVAGEGLGASGVGAAHNPTVVVENHVDGA